MTDDTTVHMQGFTIDENGDQTHCDDPDLIQGWTTYVRIETPDDPQQPFDIIRSEDHPDEPTATARAEALALEIHGDAEDYEVD